MITNITELSAFTDMEARENPLLRERLRLQHLSEGTGMAIRHAPLRLPPKYLTIASSLQLKSISLGLMNLWPGGPYNRGTLVEDLVRENAQMSNRIAAVAKPAGLIQVASYEADPVFVGGMDASAGEDVVYCLDHEQPALTRLARDFEAFLLAAGNLRWFAKQRSDDSDPADVAKEYLTCLRELGFTDEEISNWEPIAEVAFS